MKITAITERYPAAFKAYFDTHFADLLEKGHDLTVLAAGGTRRVQNAKVRAWGLAERTDYYPPTGRYLYRGLAPGVAWRVPRIWRGIEQHRTARERATRAVRLALLERTRPEAVLIHGLSAGRPFIGTRALLPETAVALYYHGGELPDVPVVPDEAAARVFAEADVVFSNTRFSADHAVGRGCPPDRVRVLPVGLDLELYPEPDPPPPLAGRAPRFLSAGRMSEEKGLIHALAALAELDARGVRDWHYGLTGGGPTRPALERFARERGLADRVTFLGTVSAERLVEEMRRADFLLLPSLHLGNWVENQAVVVQEAMLMKTIPVTTDTGGLPESVPERVRRLQVPAADPVALADRLQELLALDHAALLQLRDDGRRFVAERYDIRPLNQRLLDGLEEAAARRRG